MLPMTRESLIQIRDLAERIKGDTSLGGHYVIDYGKLIHGDVFERHAEAMKLSAMLHDVWFAAVQISCSAETAVKFEDKYGNNAPHDGGLVGSKS